MTSKSLKIDLFNDLRCLKFGLVKVQKQKTIDTENNPHLDFSPESAVLIPSPTVTVGFF